MTTTPGFLYEYLSALTNQPLTEAYLYSYIPKVPCSVIALGTTSPFDGYALHYVWIPCANPPPSQAGIITPIAPLGKSTDGYWFNVPSLVSFPPIPTGTINTLYYNNSELISKGDQAISFNGTAVSKYSSDGYTTSIQIDNGYTSIIGPLGEEPNQEHKLKFAGNLVSVADDSVNKQTIVSINGATGSTTHSMTGDIISNVDGYSGTLITKIQGQSIDVTNFPPTDGDTLIYSDQHQQWSPGALPPGNLGTYYQVGLNSTTKATNDSYLNFCGRALTSITSADGITQLNTIAGYDTLQWSTTQFPDVGLYPNAHPTTINFSGSAVTGMTFNGTDTISITLTDSGLKNISKKLDSDINIVPVSTTDNTIVFQGHCLSSASSTGGVTTITNNAYTTIKDYNGTPVTQRGKVEFVSDSNVAAVYTVDDGVDTTLVKFPVYGKGTMKQTYYHMPHTNYPDTLFPMGNPLLVNIYGISIGGSALTGHTGATGATGADAVSYYTVDSFNKLQWSTSPFPDPGLYPLAAPTTLNLGGSAVTGMTYNGSDTVSIQLDKGTGISNISKKLDSDINIVPVSTTDTTLLFRGHALTACSSTGGVTTVEHNAYTTCLDNNSTPLTQRAKLKLATDSNALVPYCSDNGVDTTLLNIPNYGKGTLRHCYTGSIGNINLIQIDALGIVFGGTSINAAGSTGATGQTGYAYYTIDAYGRIFDKYNVAATKRSDLKFANGTVVDDGLHSVITIDASPQLYYNTIKNSSGTGQTQRASLKFAGGTVTDDGTNTVYTPPVSGGGTISGLRWTGNGSFYSANDIELDFTGTAVTGATSTALLPPLGGNGVTTFSLDAGYNQILSSTGSYITKRSNVQFTGNVSVWDNNSGGIPYTTVNIPTPQAYNTIQSNYGGVTQRSVMNFLGTGVSVADDGVNTTNITINAYGRIFDKANNSVTRRADMKFANGAVTDDGIHSVITIDPSAQLYYNTIKNLNGTNQPQRAYLKITGGIAQSVGDDGTSTTLNIQAYNQVIAPAGNSLTSRDYLYFTGNCSVYDSNPYTVVTIPAFPTIYNQQVYGPGGISYTQRNNLYFTGNGLSVNDVNPYTYITVREPQYSSTVELNNVQGPQANWTKSYAFTSGKRVMILVSTSAYALAATAASLYLAIDGATVAYSSFTLGAVATAGHQTFPTIMYTTNAYSGTHTISVWTGASTGSADYCTVSCWT